MGLLSGLIGGFAEGGLNIANNAIKAEQRKSEQEFESELLMKRQAALEQLREKFEQAKAQAKREQDKADATTIEGASDDKRVERAQGIINADTGIQHTPDEVKKIIADPTWTENYGAIRNTAGGKPTEWDGRGGIINPTTSVIPSTDRTRAQELNDKADAAMGIGRTDMEKGFRDQGNLERQVTADENRTKTQQKANELAAAKQTAWEENESKKRENEAKKAEAYASMMEALLKGKDATPEKVMSYMEGRRKEIASEALDVKNQMAADLKAAEFGTPEEKAAIKAAYQPRLDEISKSRKQMDADYAHLREQFKLPELKADAPAPKTEPDKFIIGKKYKDAKGNVATYMGNGKWN